MAEHGTMGAYRTGCRCDECRQSNALRMRRVRAGTVDQAFAQMTYRRVPDVVLEGAACKGKPGDWWFPKRGVVYGIDGTGYRHVTDPDVARAFVICDTCPVKSECLEHALTASERVGIWGGTTEKERRDLRRQRRLRRAVAVSTAGSAGQSPGRTPTAGPGSSTDVEVRWPRHFNNAGHRSAGERLA